MPGYKKLDEKGKPSGFSKDMPAEGAGSRYEQDTPTFETLVTKGGQGTRGDKTYKIGAKEYERSKKSPVKNEEDKKKMAVGGMSTKQQTKVSKVMKEFKAGSLHSGKGGKVVKSPKQAVAIAISEARRMKKK